MSRNTKEIISHPFKLILVNSHLTPRRFNTNRNCKTNLMGHILYVTQTLRSEPLVRTPFRLQKPIGRREIFTVCYDTYKAQKCVMLAECRCLGAFAKLWRATIGFVKSAHLSVCPHETTRRSLDCVHEIYSWGVLENLSRKRVIKILQE